MTSKLVSERISQFKSGRRRIIFIMVEKKSKKSKEEYFNACPKCGSVNFHRELDTSFITGNQGIFVCNNCGYNAPIFPEVSVKTLAKFKSETKQEVKKEVNKKEKQKIIQVDSIIVLILGFILLFFVGIGAFVVVIGGYYIIKFLIRRKR